MTSSSRNTPANRFTSLLLSWMNQLGPVLGLACVWVFFAVVEHRTAQASGLQPSFMSWHNQLLILLQTAVVGTAAIGATLIIISGGIDLSVGSTIALVTMVVAWLLRIGMPAPFAAFGGIYAGVICGLIIGSAVIGHLGRCAAIAAGVVLGAWAFWLGAGVIGTIVIIAVVSFVLFQLDRRFIPNVKLAPFIVTLGMWGVLRGVAKGFGNSQPIYPGSDSWLSNLMHDTPFGMKGLPVYGVWLLLIVAGLAVLVLKFTRFGRHVYAVGSNEQTARLCGVHISRTKMMIYGIGIGCAGLAGLLQFSFLQMGDPSTAEGYELKVIAAVVIGGASLAGGEGSIIGTLVGALIMSVIDSGCGALHLDNWIQEVVTGIIIVLAVAIDRLRRRRIEP
ncbi:MAG: ABC transporter permease [Planctomycetes bacterium]|nr:ABC transporter permease [Planctomycetota bacterium]NOG54485.1 ABC transporter permease [Planctomycetota bacterium]